MTSPPSRPPSANELLDNPVVIQALDEAWAASESGDSQNRHEEGGWIYMNLATAEISTRRAPRGRQASIDLRHPPHVNGCFVVGKFHTHPNPSSEGWDPGPSTSDRVLDERHGVPDLIRADDGVHLSGPNTRRGGLVGELGYPA